jgi:hypothetical protein
MNEKQVNELVNEILVPMIFNGVLLKNVNLFLTNRGFKTELAKKLVRMAEIRSNDWNYYKSK